MSVSGSGPVVYALFYKQMAVAQFTVNFLMHFLSPVLMRKLVFNAQTRPKEHEGGDPIS